MKVRIFYEKMIIEKSLISLENEYFHYLKNVLRVKLGQKVFLFNQKQGEFLTEIKDLQKNKITLEVKNLNRNALTAPNINLLFAPVKNITLSQIARKSTELGVKEIYPITTENSVIYKLNHRKFKLNIIEAVQQSNRIDIPILHEISKLSKLLENWDTEHKIIFCDETNSSMTPDKMLNNLESATKRKYSVLIGPEGGFQSEEIKYLKSLSFVIPISMGVRIMRVDTAIVAALTLVYNYVGDWENNIN